VFVASWQKYSVLYDTKQLVLCKYSKFWIESNSYLLFDSKLMQLFKIFEYLFNRDQPGDWHAICLYFASHKLLYSPASEPSAAPRVFLPLPLPWVPWPRTHAREAAAPVRACVLPTPVSDRAIITAAGKHSARSVERWTFCQYCIVDGLIPLNFGN